MNPDASNLKKRKLFAAVAEDLGHPVAKHICCDAAVGSESDSLFLKTVYAEDVEIVDTLVESTQDSNSVHGDSQSSTEVVFDDVSFFTKTNSHDEASSSWTNSRSATFRNENDPFSLESRIMRAKGDSSALKEGKFPQQHNTAFGWQDFDDDCLEECISAHHCKDSKQTAEELGEFLNSSGVNTTLFMLSSEKWNADQEAQMARRKPTIDQEFEQYFSTLML
ncbi:unnamed protein product [Amaranthus hypochondriacus]